MARPGSITAAATLGFLQALIAAAGTVYLTWVADSGFWSRDELGAGLWAVCAVGLVGAVLLVAGVARLHSGRGLFLTAIVLQVLLCLFWTVFLYVNDDVFFVPLLIAGVPLTAFFLASGARARRSVVARHD
jgi:hypothetical protein